MAFACNLCHGQMAVNQQLMTAHCGHMYHGNCLSSYLEENNLESRPKCPCCQLDLNGENGLIQLHPIPYKPDTPPLDQDQESGTSKASSVCSSSGTRSCEQGPPRSVVPQANLVNVQRALHEAKMKMEEHGLADAVRSAQVGSGSGSGGNLHSALSDSSVSSASGVGGGAENPSADDAPLIKVGSDIVFMMDGRIVSIDQLLPSSANKKNLVSEVKAVGNDGRDRNSARQQMVLPERSLEPQPNFMQPPRAHENKQMTIVEHSLRRDIQFDLHSGQPPASYLPPAPSTSGGMWGAPGWPTGVPWRAPASGGAPGTNVHRIDSMQYYPSPFIREPVRQQPPYPIQIPLHRPTGAVITGHGHGQYGSGNSASTFQRSVYESSSLSKRKASPPEQLHGGSRPNLETILMSMNETVAARNGQARGFAVPRNGNYGGGPSPLNYDTDDSGNQNQSGTGRTEDIEHEVSERDGGNGGDSPKSQSQQYQHENRNSPN